MKPLPSAVMNMVFLGVNDVGMRIYEWLTHRDETTVDALLTEPDQLEVIRDIKPDLIVSVGFDHLVPADILTIPSEGAINLHPSLLPHNRGKSPNVWPLVDGTPAGVTLHYMDEAFDTGDIIAQREVETSFADTGKRLHRRLEDAQYDLFTELWPDIESGTVERIPQDSENGSYHTTEDFLELCELNPDAEVRIEDLLNRLRALTFPPFDNAQILVDDETYYVDIEIRRADENDEEEEADGLLSSY
jgi:methionyl-tRNA formyltransferase